jgi:hypothetical protein
VSENIRIELERSGGFAGITRRASVDTSALPADQANRIAELVRRVDFTALAAKAGGPPRAPDRFQYDLDIHHGGQHHRLTFGERAVTPELRPLLDYMLKHHS